MDKPAKNRLTRAVLVLNILACLLFAVYIGAYFTGSSESARRARMRTFRAKWQCAIFLPAAQVEAVVTGEWVYLRYQESRWGSGVYFLAQPLSMLQ